MVTKGINAVIVEPRLSSIRKASAKAIDQSGSGNGFLASKPLKTSHRSADTARANSIDGLMSILTRRPPGQ